MKSMQSTTRFPGKTVSVASLGQSDCMLAAIQAAIDRGSETRVEVPGSGKIWIDPKTCQYWQQVGDPHSFFVTPSRRAKAKRAPIPEGRHTSGPLEELLWDAAFIGSGGQLFEGHQLHDLVELNWWPNLTRVAHEQSTFSLCAFLSTRPSSMHLAFRALHVPEDEAFRFYNAALVSGCLKVLKTRSETSASLSSVGSSEADDSKQKRSDVVPFWRRLFAKVSGL